MRPYHHAAAPSLPAGVKSRLKRLDPDLFVTWSPWMLDALTGRPIETNWGALVPAPGFYLWRRDRDAGKTYWVSVFERFGHEQVANLEADLARFMSPDEIIRRVAANRRRNMEAGRKRCEERRADVYAANKSRIVDLMNGMSGRRPPKTYSYPGQQDRRSSMERQEFLRDAREDGWELPDHSGD